MNKILVIDDNQLNLMYLTVILEDEGYIVFSADSGEQALSSLEKNLPDIILLDIRMPVLDGFEVCKRIKQIEKFKEIPIIFLSSVTDTKDKVKAFRLGAVDFINRPFQKEELKIRLKTHFSLLKKETELVRYNKILKKEKEITNKIKNIQNKILNTVSEGFYINSKYYNIEYMNDPMIKLLGGDKTLQKCYNAIYQRDKICEWCVNKKLKKNELITFEIKHPVLGKHFIIKKTLLDNDSVITAYNDISKIKRNELLSLETQKIAKLGFWEYDIIKKKITWSDELYRILEAEPQEFNANFEFLMGKVHPEDKNKVNEYYVNLMNKKKSCEIEYRLIFKTGKIKYVLEQSKIYFDNKGKAIRFVGTILDNSKNKQTEKVLKKYESIISATGEHMSFIDKNYIYQAVNKSYLKAHKKSKDEIIGNSLLNLLGEDTFLQIKDKLDKCFTGKEINYQKWIDFPDKEKRYMDIFYYPFREESNSVSGIVVSSRDVTHKKLVEDALRSSEKQYRYLIENSNEAIFLLYKDKFKIINKKFTQLFGYTTEEVYNPDFNFIQLLAPKSKKLIDSFQKQVNSKKSTSKSYRFTGLTKKVIEIEIEVSVTYIKYKEGTAIQGIIRDISEQIKSEQKLELHRVAIEKLLEVKTQQLTYNEKKFRTIFEQAAIGVALINAEDSKYIQVNDMFCNITGYSRNKLLEISYEQLTHPIDLLKQKKKNKLLESGKINKFTIKKRYYKKDNSLVWVELTASMHKCEGIPSHIIGIIKDITKNKKTEKILQNALEKEKELNKMKSNFISTSSHQFRTPLTTIKSNSSLIEMYIKNVNSETKQMLTKCLGRINEETQTLNDLMDNILLIGQKDAKKTPFKPILTDIIEICEEIIKEKKFLYQKNREVEFLFEGDRELVYLDKNLIIHIISNLLSNAFKYSETNPQLKIVFKKKELIISVKDEGIGIPEKVQKHLFSSFYRADNVQTIKGTGLGLIVIKEYTEMHKGTVVFNSKENEGTEFIVKIPRG